MSLESDFDNSDDLASLLDDDDDDVFAKKVFGNPPAKTSASESKKSKNLWITTIILCLHVSICILLLI